MSFLPEVKCTGSLRAGSFRGFDVEISLSEYGKRTLALKGQLRHIIELGTDARGNIQRIENALTGLDRQLENARGHLEDLERQVENAREELKKPFPQEAELAEKSARLIELNAELDMENSAPVQAGMLKPSARPCSPNCASRYRFMTQERNSKRRLAFEHTRTVRGQNDRRT